MFCSSVHHEFMHAFGVYHMHSRPDRDKYVTIMWDNIKKVKDKNGKLVRNPNFIEKKSKDVDLYKVPYDPYSIMHYHSTAAAIDDSKPTIKSRVNTFFFFFLKIL